MIINGKKTVYVVGYKSCRIENGRAVIGEGPINGNDSVVCKTATAGVLVTVDKILEKVTGNLSSTTSVERGGGPFGQALTLRMEGKAINYGTSVVKSGGLFSSIPPAIYVSMTTIISLLFLYNKLIRKINFHGIIWIWIGRM